MLDLLIKDTTIIDGSGTTRYRGSVGTEKGKLHLLPYSVETEADYVIDGKGLITCPGFIDSHSHGDISLGKDFASLCKVSQGITTQVTGMCSYSLFPVSPNTWQSWKESCGLFLNRSDFPKELSTFTTAETYFSYAETLKIPENVVMLVGHGAVRCAVMGNANRAPTPDELGQMKALMRDAMEAGAAGFSTGLMYIPSVFAQPDEIIELAKIVAEYDGVYATHIRSESNQCVEAVKEAIDVARKTGIRVIISHLKVQGKTNWGKASKIIALIRQANNEGLNVSCDQYPYTACMTLLSDLCPPWYFKNGLSSIVKHLQNRSTREHIKQEMLNPTTPYENVYMNSGGYDGIFITNSEKLPEAEGKTLAAYATEQGKDPFDAYSDIMIANGGIGGAVFHTMCDEDLLEIMKYERTAVGTDGLLRSMHSKSHPRAFGTFPHAIQYFVKDHAILSLEEMIRRMTSLTASMYKIPNKGLIKDGYDADLVVFDYDTFKDAATYTNPAVPCAGNQVIINGCVVYANEQITGETPGTIIRYHR